MRRRCERRWAREHARCGVLLALVTATISGFAVFLNGYAVKRFDDATVYTTAKNGVAGILLVLVALPLLTSSSQAGRVAPRPRSGLQWAALLALGVVGGSVAFVLFFEGLARASSTQAAFIHKTLVIWVALLAVPLLRERLAWPHFAAIGLLVAGQAAIAGDAGTIAIGTGEVMIFAATLLWAIEVVFVKRLLESLAAPTLAAARLGIGTALLLALSLSRDAGASSRRSARRSGAGRSSRACCWPATSQPGTRRSPARKRST